MTTTTQTTASATFDAMTTDDRWDGYGYLGERHHALDSTDPECPPQPDMVEAADQCVIDWAAAHRWSDKRLFEWANSKSGRWYGDAMFGGTGTVADRFEQAIRWRVLL